MTKWLVAAVASASVAALADDCQVALDRNLTLRSRMPYSIEAEHGRMAAGEARLAFMFPRPVGASCEDAGPPPLLRLKSPDSASGEFSARLVAGEEYRFSDESVWATEAGGLFYGRKGPATAHLDARVFSELGGDPSRPSYDGESIDNQEKSVTGAVDYRSYARFRGDMNLDLPLGRLTVARDAAQWGPGLYANGVFSEEAPPFYQYVYSARIGPLSITSLYGDLEIDSDQNSSANLAGRSLFAHRYELALGNKWLLGISEELILYDMAKPYLFAPIFPLFIAKSLLPEANNNGNLAFDATWRSPWNGLIYGEFLLDDLESPTSLFLKDYVQNKWAALAGAHFIKDIGTARTGAIIEFSSVEPWVYSHFTPATAQAANLGQPLGNPYGPDSRTIVLKAYARSPTGWYASLTSGLFWKGRGPGADLEQPTPPDPLQRKIRLEGESSPDFAIEPYVSYAWKCLATSVDGRLGHGSRLRAAVRAFL